MISKEMLMDNFKNGKENNQPSPGSTEISRQDEPKEEPTKTPSNQTDKN